MRLGTKLILLCGFCGVMCSSDTKEPPLARVGTKVITRAELQQRAEFSPDYLYHGPESERATYLLDLLINEKLAALAAQEAQLDTTETLRQLSDFIENMALSRELYRQDVQKHVHVEQTEIDEAVKYQSQTRIIRYLVFNDMQKAQYYRERLKIGLSFGDALQELYGPAADTTANRREIKWGYNEQAIEEAAYALKLGEMSPVVAVEGAFMVMILQDVLNNTIATESEIARRRAFARRILTARKEALASDAYLKDFMRKKELKFNKPLIKIMADYLAEKTMADVIGKDHPSLPEGLVSAEVIEDARAYLQSQLDTPLVTFVDGQLTLGQILAKWHAYQFPVDQRNRQNCSRSIVRGISLIVRDELLAGEARKRGYAKLASVRKEVEIWRDHYLCSMWQKHITASEMDSSFSWKSLLERERLAHPVKIDSTLLAETEVTSFPILAIRIGQYNGRVMPPWPCFD